MNHRNKWVVGLAAMGLLTVLGVYETRAYVDSPAVEVQSDNCRNVSFTDGPNDGSDRYNVTPAITCNANEVMVGVRGKRDTWDYSNRITNAPFQLTHAVCCKLSLRQ